MNRYMHPRNIYKKPPNFAQLAEKYPEFRRLASLVRMLIITNRPLTT